LSMGYLSLSLPFLVGSFPPWLCILKFQHVQCRKTSALS
jgi:hypothetical protein